MDRDLMAPRHGTPWSFRNGCRCDDCRQASLDYYRACRARKRAELGLPPFVRFPRPNLWAQIDLRPRLPLRRLPTSRDDLPP